MDLFGPMVFAMCRRSGLSSEASADVMQETFLSVNKSLASFQYRNGSDTFRGWLTRIAQHRIADFHRRRTAVLSAIGGSQADAAFHAITVDSDSIVPSNSDLRAVVQRAAALVQMEFEPKSWQAFWRTAIEGLSAPEAAVELGMQPAAVRKAKSRIARRLRELLGDVG